MLVCKREESLIYRSKDAQGRASVAAHASAGRSGLPVHRHSDNVEGFVPDELLRATEWFFSPPLENSKRLATAPKQLNPVSKSTYLGYFPS